MEHRVYMHVRRTCIFHTAPFLYLYTLDRVPTVFTKNLAYTRRSRLHVLWYSYDYNSSVGATHSSVILIGIYVFIRLQQLSWCHSFVS